MCYILINIIADFEYVYLCIYIVDPIKFNLRFSQTLSIFLSVLLPLNGIAFTTQPPMMDETNYPYWKTIMRAFLTSIHERLWIFVMNGWTSPNIIEDEIPNP